MVAAVAPQGPQRGTRVAARHQRGAGDGQRGGDPGRDPVGRVVQAGRGPAEPQVPRRVVTYHRVQRVDRTIGRQARRPGDGAPQQRRHHGVRGVLRDRLDDGAGYLGGVKAGRIAAAQARQDLPRGIKIVAGKGYR